MIMNFPINYELIEGLRYGWMFGLNTVKDK